MRLQWDLESHSEWAGGQSFTSDGGEVLTDELGCVSISISSAQAKQLQRDLTITATLDTTLGTPLESASVQIPIPDEFHSGQLDLGMHMLAPFGAPERYRDLDDKGLERRFLTLIDKGSRATALDGDPHVEILCEMARRGGEELERFLSENADRIPGEGGRRAWGSADELAFRTAIARIRHEPDPLEVVINPESVLETEFPEQPKIHCSLRNNQRGAWSLVVPKGGGPHWCGFEVTDSRGKRLTPGTRPEQWGGVYTMKELAPGETMSLRVDFGSAYVLPSAGEYRVRVYYSPNEDLDSLPTMQGRIVASSTEFTVHVRPRSIRLTQARLDALRLAVRELDPARTLPLVNWHWRSTLTFRGESVDPEDALFRAGLDALPALFESLEDSTLEPDRRAWVFAMLWNILGVHDPSQRHWDGVIGPSSRFDAWPTSSEASTSFGHTERREFGKIDPAKQAAFTRLWQATKANYELKIVP